MSFYQKHRTARKTLKKGNHKDKELKVLMLLMLPVL